MKLELSDGSPDRFFLGSLAGDEAMSASATREASGTDISFGLMLEAVRMAT